jgi:thiamine-phosphate pyrophosphorylase
MPQRAAPRTFVKPIVCYVTAREALGADSTEKLLAKISSAAAAGVDWVQIRERDMQARELLTLTKSAIAAAGKTARVLVNERLDVALAAGAAGVHLRENSVPVSNLVRWLRQRTAPTDFLAGVSCHSVDQARQADAAGASYVFFGPVFETPAKKKFGPPQGIARLADVCGSVRIPVIAIGGVNDANASDCLQAGASGIAAIRMFQETGQAELRAVIERIHRGRGADS